MMQILVLLLTAEADPNIRCIDGYGRVYKSDSVLLEIMRSHGGTV